MGIVTSVVMVTGTKCTSVFLVKRHERPFAARAYRYTSGPNTHTVW